jgi:hypothetical protein
MLAQKSSAAAPNTQGCGGKNGEMTPMAKLGEVQADEFWCFIRKKNGHLKKAEAYAGEEGGRSAVQRLRPPPAVSVHGARFN